MNRTTWPTDNPDPILLDTRLALSKDEAAAALALSPRTIDDLIADGSLPCVRVGRRVLLPVDGLRRWLADNSEGGAGATQASNAGMAVSPDAAKGVAR
ncbi:MAG: excisionase family DNA-binding protein [Phycisphaerales bacterium]|nr:excisionase family DNA-binding protein [Phycisphaerales bacterium]